MPIGPLLFEPYYRPQIWGGRRLQELFGRPLPPTGTYGESWEISAHQHHVSRIVDGPFAGYRLTDFAAEHSRELYGPAEPFDGKFPLLIKLLDCQELLSVQVHPTDAKAAEILGDEKGKTEAWVILDVGPEGRIYAGLKPGVDRVVFEEHLAAGTVDACLHSFQPKVGDCLYLQAGTVHAVGGGVVMAEVQQSSDATFRLFDWNRVGPDGKPRQLHINESLRSIDFSLGPRSVQTPEPMGELYAGNRGEKLLRSFYFHLDRYWLSGRLANPYAGQMSIWMVLEGDAELFGFDGVRTFRRGSTMLMPADSSEFSWQPASSAQPTCLLGITLPLH